MHGSPVQVASPARKPTLFDAILQPPIPHDDNGWKQYTGGAWPQVGITYVYLYDTSGDDTGTSGEVLINYNWSSGSVTVVWFCIAHFERLSPTARVTRTRSQQLLGSLARTGAPILDDDQPAVARLDGHSGRGKVG